MKGGRRRGSGRKRIDPALLKIPVGYRLPRWLVLWMRQQDKAASVLIEEALVEKYQLKKNTIV